MPAAKLILDVPGILAVLDAAVPQCLTAAGEAAVSAVRETMLTGYAQPIYLTGALHDSIAFDVNGQVLTVGSDVPHAAPVHDGTASTPPRPFLQDGLLHHADSLAAALASSLKEAFTP